MRFEFATATRIVFGAGSLRQVGAMASELGRRALVVTGRDGSRAAPLLETLASAKVAASVFPVAGEPETHTIVAGVVQARAEGSDLLISYGGGSALDAAKAIAALLTNPGDLLDYLEIIGRGKALTQPAAPFIAIPTTAGTGSEVTRNAVLASPEHRVKVSLRSPLMLPRVALIDPELTYDLPPAITAWTGLDALTQLIEPYVCARANPLTDSLCGEGICRAARFLPVAVAEGHHAPARENMAVASLFGGLALANAGLGAVHGFAGPIGGMFPAPHGAICAALLPHVMSANLAAIASREPSSPVLERYRQVAAWLMGYPAATGEDGVDWIRQLVHQLQIPPLRTYGIRSDHFPELVEKAARASSMKANPVTLSSEELTHILHQAL